MSVTHVINRINDIQRQFGAAGAESGYPAAAASAVGGSDVAASTVSNHGVIIGQMGGGKPSLAEISSQQLALSQQAFTPAAGNSEVINLTNPLPGVDIVSDYGERLHPIHGDVRMHHGVDLDADSGTPIAAISDGIVAFAGERGGYGNLVIIDHGGGYETRYAHQEHLTVTAGDLVNAGDLIGSVGSTGNSTGPHLHFEVRRDGVSVDPEPWLRP